MMAEAFALQRALEDVDFRRALVDFFLAQSDEATLQCREAMNQRPAQIENALGHAAVARASLESFNKLEAFVKDQLSR